MSETKLFKPVYPSDGRKGTIWVKLNGLTLEIFVPIPGDHPLLITIDLLKHTYTAEGYD